MLDSTFDQLELMAAGGKPRRGIPIRSDEDLQRLSKVRLPDDVR